MCVRFAVSHMGDSQQAHSSRRNVGRVSTFCSRARPQRWWRSFGSLVACTTCMYVLGGMIVGRRVRVRLLSRKNGIILMLSKYVRRVHATAGRVGCRPTQSDTNAVTTTTTTITVRLLEDDCIRINDPFIFRAHTQIPYGVVQHHARSNNTGRHICKHRTSHQHRTQSVWRKQTH